MFFFCLCFRVEEVRWFVNFYLKVDGKYCFIVGMDKIIFLVFGLRVICYFLMGY